MLVSAAVYHIDFTEGSTDARVLRALTDNQVSKLGDASEEIICMTGRYMYGPQGMTVKNLLLER